MHPPTYQFVAMDNNLLDNLCLDQYNQRTFSIFICLFHHDYIGQPGKLFHLTNESFFEGFIYFILHSLLFIVSKLSRFCFTGGYVGFMFSWCSTIIVSIPRISSAHQLKHCWCFTRNFTSSSLRDFDISFPILTFYCRYFRLTKTSSNSSYFDVSKTNSKICFSSSLLILDSSFSIVFIILISMIFYSSSCFLFVFTIYSRMFLGILWTNPTPFIGVNFTCWWDMEMIRSNVAWDGCLKLHHKED